MRIKHLAVGAVIGSMTMAGAAQASDVPRLSDREDLKNFPARWREVMPLFRVPALAVGVVKDGELYAAEAWGVRDNSGTAPDTETRFYIASITKTFTATAICKLESEGKLSFDDPVKKYLPRFALAEADASKIRIRDLLDHAAGIECGPVVLLDAYTGEITEDRYYAMLAKYGKSSGKVAYSNVHYTLLGRIIEAITGKPWRNYLRDEVFANAGMSRTSGYQSTRDSNAASPMRIGADGKAEVISPWKTDATMHAAGGLDSTALDMMKWIALNVNDGKVGSTRVLKEGVAPSMFVLNAKLEKPDGFLRVMEGYGWAWNVGNYKKLQLATHGGGYDGTSAYVALLPEKKAGFVILINASGMARGLGDVIAIDLLERLSGIPAGQDIYAGYTKRAKESPMPEMPQRTNLGAESLPAGVDACVGVFVNADLGTLTVERAGNGLAMRLGTAELDLKAKDGGFTIGPASVLDGATGSFEIENGVVRRVIITEQELGKSTFERKAK